MRTLFEQARRGDSSAQAELDRIIRRIARAVCRSGGPGGADVDWEDVAQEAGQRFFTVGIHQFRGDGSGESYLYAIVRTTVLQAVRRSSRRRAREENVEPAASVDPPNPGTGLEVRRIFRQLPEECARLLEQVFLHGVPYSDLASEMDMLESSVRVKVSRCLRKAMDIARDGSA